MDSSLWGVLLSLLAALGFGLFAVFARPAMLYTSFSVGVLVSAAAGWLAVAAVGLVLAGLALFRVSLVGLGWFAFIGLANVFLGRLFYLSAIRRIGVSRSTPLVGATPLIAALLALLLYGEKIGPLLGLGIASVVVGVVLIMGGNSAGDRMGRNLLFGYLLAAGAALSYAVGQVASRLVVQKIAPPLVVSFYSFLFSSLFLLLYFLPQLPRDLKENNRPRGLLLFTANGVAGALGVTALYAALQYSPVAVVSPVSSINPLFALFFTHLFLRHLERVTMRTVLGTLLVVGGVVLITLTQI